VEKLPQGGGDRQSWPTQQSFETAVGLQQLNVGQALTAGNQEQCQAENDLPDGVAALAALEEMQSFLECRNESERLGQSCEERETGKGGGADAGWCNLETREDLH
jgi:hypothetical protein